MAYVTNQLLLGDASRDRSYTPHKVDIEVFDADGEWPKNNQVIAYLKLSKKSRDYHLVSLTPGDLASMLPKLVPKSDAQTKVRIVSDTLLQLNDDDFNDLIDRARCYREELAKNHK